MAINFHIFHRWFHIAETAVATKNLNFILVLVYLYFQILSKRTNIECSATLNKNNPTEIEKLIDANNAESKIAMTRQAESVGFVGIYPQSESACPFLQI